MHVAAHYPDTFPLAGYDLALFDYRLRKMFRGGWLSTCDLRQMLALLRVDDSDTARTKALLDELAVVHCDRFSKLPEVLRSSLPGKVGELFGIKLIVDRRARWHRARNRAATVLLVIAVCVAIGVGVRNVIPYGAAAWRLHQEMSSLDRGLAKNDAAMRDMRAVLDSLPTLPTIYSTPAPLRQVADGTYAADPIIDSIVLTHSPSTTVRTTLAQVPRNDGTQYKVHVTVTPVASAPSSQ